MRSDSAKQNPYLRRLALQLVPYAMKIKIAVWPFAFVGRSQEKIFCFYAVADGLGGMRGGSDCAESAIAILISELVASATLPDLARRLSNSLQTANQLLYGGYKENGGTTLSAVLISRIAAIGMSVGDSRIYAHLRSGELEQLSVDDTLAGRLAEIRSVSTRTVDEPFHDYLAQFVGQNSSLELEPINLSLQRKSDGDGNKSSIRGVLLCSDGVHRIGKDVVREVSRGANSSRDLVLRLIRMADWSGGHDNATALYASSVRDFFNGTGDTALRPMIEVWDSFDHFQYGFFRPERISSVADALRQSKPKSLAAGKKKTAKKKKKKAKRAKKRASKKEPESQTNSDETNDKQQQLNIEITDSIDDDG